MRVPGYEDYTEAAPRHPYTERAPTYTSNVFSTSQGAHDVTLNFKQLARGFACEITGINLWELQPDGVLETLRDAYCEHGLLVFRRQVLTEAELIDVARIFGAPEVYVEKGWHSHLPEVSVVSNMRNGAGHMVGGLSSKELNWHTDQSYNQYPVTGCFLYAQVVPASGSRTSWASLHGAYEALGASERQRVDAAKGTYSYAARTGTVTPGVSSTEMNQTFAERIRNTPDVQHALVNCNPKSGRPALYLDPGTLIALDGKQDESTLAFLDALTGYATADANVYHHDWQLGDLVLWDNAVTLHRRDAFDDEESRMMKRMIFSLPAERHICPAPIN